MRHHSRRLFVLASCFSLALLLGCSGASESKLPAPKPMPSGVSFAGKWYSTQFEHMYLRQVGDSVRGIYTYKYGGTLEGKVNGNLLVFDWIDPGETKYATRTRKGKGYFQLTTDKNGNAIIVGKWGYNKSHQDGGIWKAEWVRDMDSDDPRSLKEWRDKEVR